MFLVLLNVDVNIRLSLVIPDKVSIVNTKITMSYNHIYIYIYIYICIYIYTQILVVPPITARISVLPTQHPLYKYNHQCTFLDQNHAPPTKSRL